MVSGVYNGATYLYYGNEEKEENEENDESNLNEKLNSEIEILTKSINDLNQQIKLLQNKSDEK